MEMWVSLSRIYGEFSIQFLINLFIIDWRLVIKVFWVEVQVSSLSVRWMWCIMVMFI